MDDRFSRDFEILLGLFRDGGWKEISVHSETFSLHLATQPGTRPALRAVPERLAKQTPVASEAPHALKPEDATIDPTWRLVGAPNLGTFYRSPKPGSPPFVEVGQVIADGAELCLIEVMKLFTSVRSPVAGTVRRIVANDGELVEGDQPLMYIEQA